MIQAKAMKASVRKLYSSYRYQDISASFHLYVLRIVLHENIYENIRNIEKISLKNWYISSYMSLIHVHLIYIWEDTNRSIIFFIDFIILLSAGPTWAYVNTVGKEQLENALLKLWKMQNDRRSWFSLIILANISKARKIF